MKKTTIEYYKTAVRQAVNARERIEAAKASYEHECELTKNAFDGGILGENGYKEQLEKLAQERDAKIEGALSRIDEVAAEYSAEMAELSRLDGRDKVQQYNRKYWERKAEKAKNIRASWTDYGIDKERYRELLTIAKSDEYAEIALECAIRADRKSAGHIILSVVEGLSYERVEFHGKLGRCPLGRSDFYGAKRLFFHYLDCALKDGETMVREERHE